MSAKLKKVQSVSEELEIEIIEKDWECEDCESVTQIEFSYPRDAWENLECAECEGTALHVNPEFVVSMWEHEFEKLGVKHSERGYSIERV